MQSLLKKNKECLHNESKFLPKEQIYYCGSCGKFSQEDLSIVWESGDSFDLVDIGPIKDKKGDSDVKV